MANSRQGVEKPPDADAETAWKESLENLQQQIVLYNKVKARGNERETSKAAETVAAAMDDLGDKHTDPNVKRDWQRKARELRNAGVEERDGVLEDIGKGLLTLLTVPFALVGAVFMTAGAILDGVGSIFRGLGRLAQKGYVARK